MIGPSEMIRWENLLTLKKIVRYIKPTVNYYNFGPFLSINALNGSGHQRGWRYPNIFLPGKESPLRNTAPLLTAHHPL